MTRIITYIFAFIALPLIAVADCTTEHAHAGEEGCAAVQEAANFGASALLVPMSMKWWGLLIVSAVLTSILSYIVWRYLQVPLPKKSSDTVKK